MTTKTLNWRQLHFPLNFSQRSLFAQLCGSPIPLSCGRCVTPASQVLRRCGAALSPHPGWHQPSQPQGMVPKFSEVPQDPAARTRNFNLQLLLLETGSLEMDCFNRGAMGRRCNYQQLSP